MILKPYGSSTNASIAMPSTIEFCRVIGGEWLRCMVLVDGVGWGERRFGGRCTTTKRKKVTQKFTRVTIYSTRPHQYS